MVIYWREQHAGLMNVVKDHTISCNVIYSFRCSYWHQQKSPRRAKSLEMSFVFFLPFFNRYVTEILPYGLSSYTLLFCG